MLNRIFLTLILSLACISYSSFAFSDTHFVHRHDVQKFINEMVIKHKFNKKELNTLFNHVKVRPQIMKSIKKPMEASPWYSYQKIFINNSHINEGIAFWNKHHKALERAEKVYGVPSSIIVATIGVETKYGKNKGEYPVIDALSNVAFSDSPRAKFFRSELEQFLLLTKEQHLNPLKVRGSYAGAMGQPQFMPSSYRYYAVSFAGNGKIDLNNNIDDIIVSVANYYNKHGWKMHHAVAIPARKESGIFTKNITEDVLKKNISNESLPKYGIYPYRYLHRDETAKVVQLKNHHGNEYWLGLHNFQVIKRYNPSDLYAMAVYQLSYFIADKRGKTNDT